MAWVDDGTATRVAPLLPFVALIEVYYVSMRASGELEAARRHALLPRSGVPVLREMDDATVIVAARLKARHQLSLAGSIAAAYAIRHSAVLPHQDAEFTPPAHEVALEALPYKPSSSQPQAI